MAKKIKKRTAQPSFLRRAFRMAGAGLVALNLSGPLIFAPLGDQREDLATDLGVTAEIIRRSTPTNVHILYPEQKEALLYAKTQFAGALAAEFERYADPKNQPYDFFGLMTHHYLVGPSSLLNFLTLNSLPALTQCTVVVPSGQLTLETIQSALVTLPRNEVRNFPGRAEDYRKLHLLHELEHCNQNPKNRERNELEADLASIQYFLQDGGNPEVVRSTIYIRALNAMEAFLFAGDREDESTQYTMAPVLAQIYLENGPAFDPKDAEPSYREAIKLLNDKARSLYGSATDLFLPSLMHQTALAVLNDPELEIRAETRLVLELNVRAYEFFTTSPPAVAPPLSAPALS